MGMNNKNLDDYFEKNFKRGKEIGECIGGAISTIALLGIYQSYGKELGDMFNNFLGINNSYFRTYNSLILMTPIGFLFGGLVYLGGSLGEIITGNILKKKKGFEDFLRKKYNEEINKAEKNKNI